jgi:hypothetical protein
MGRPKKARTGRKRMATSEELRAVAPCAEAAVIPLGRVTRYLVTAEERPLVVVQAPNRAAAAAIVGRMQASPQQGTPAAVSVTPMSKVPAAMRTAWQAVVAYEWHPVACPSCLRVWRSPAWAVDTCPICLGLAGIEVE